MPHYDPRETSENDKFAMKVFAVICILGGSFITAFVILTLILNGCAQ